MKITYDVIFIRATDNDCADANAASDGKRYVARETLRRPLLYRVTRGGDVTRA
jgi:hypothetical protein